MASPRPVPWARVVKNGSKMCASLSAGIPGPVSLTVTTTWPPVRARRDRHLSLVVHDLDRVQDEVQEDLLHLSPVRLDDRDVVAEVADDLDRGVFRVVPEHVEDPLDEAVKIGRDQVHRLGAGEQQEIVDGPAQPVDLMDDLDADVVTRVPLGVALEEDLAAAPDARQRVSDLVGHHRRQLADGGQALALEQLELRAA